MAANTSNPTIGMGALETSGIINAVASEAVIAGRFAKITTTAVGVPTCAMCDAGESPDGVFAESYASGATAAIIQEGVFLMEADGAAGAIAKGDRLKPGANGIAIVALHHGNRYGAIALEPSTTEGSIIRVRIEYGFEVKTDSTALSDADGTASIAAADMLGLHTDFVSTYNGAVALAIPAANGFSVNGANVTKYLSVRKTGTDGAITITPASGTIQGSATHTAIDNSGADTDRAVFRANPVTNDWELVYSLIA